jgi:hypothetical protein
VTATHPPPTSLPPPHPPLLDDEGAKGLQACKLCGVLLTHLHMGHYLGLMQFGREAMDWKGLQVGGIAMDWKQLQAGGVAGVVRKRNMRGVRHLASAAQGCSAQQDMSLCCPGQTLHLDAWVLGTHPCPCAQSAAVSSIGRRRAGIGLTWRSCRCFACTSAMLAVCQEPTCLDSSSVRC